MSSHVDIGAAVEEQLDTLEVSVARSQVENYDFRLARPEGRTSLETNSGIRQTPTLTRDSTALDSEMLQSSDTWRECIRIKEGVAHQYLARTTKVLLN